MHMLKRDELARTHNDRIGVTANLRSFYQSLFNSFLECRWYINLNMLHMIGKKTNDV